MLSPSEIPMEKLSPGALKQLFIAGHGKKFAEMKSTQVRELLHEAAYDEAVHRDNLVVERNVTTI